MTFAKPIGSNKEIRTSATNILERIGDWLVIVFQIDHQDLTEKVKELGAGMNPTVIVRPC